MRDNPVKTKLLAGGHAFGLFAMEFFTPGFPQIVKAAGAEFILFDMEHSAAGIDVMKNQIASANERTLLMLQIETERGLENLDAIAAVPGFDSLWIGFLDLSNFLGVHGDYGHPKYLDAIDRIVTVGRRHAKVLGTAAPSEAFAKDYYAKGFRMIAHASDFGLLQSALSQRLQALSRFAQSGS